MMILNLQNEKERLDSLLYVLLHYINFFGLNIFN